MNTVQGSTLPVQGSQYNWVTIALIIGAIVIFSNQKGCNLDLGLILKPKTVDTTDIIDIPEPSSEYKTSKLEAFRLEIGKNSKKAANLAAFYYAFADILSRNPESIVTTKDFREHSTKSINLMIKNDPDLNSPAMGVQIDSYLQDFIPLTVEKLDKTKAKNCLLALAWTCKNVEK